MKKILLSLPFLGVSVLCAPFSMAAGCENPVEAIDPLTSEIYMECPLDKMDSYVPYAEQYSDGASYDYFQEEYKRIESYIASVSADIAQFPSDMADMTDEEKRVAFGALSDSIMYSVESDISYLKSQSSDADKKSLVKKLQKKLNDTKSQLKAMKKKLNLLDNSEYSAIQSVKDSFSNLTENVSEAKELYSVIESELSEAEKKKAKRAMKMVDSLYVKAKKQAENFESSVINRPENVDPWTIQSKYYNAETRVNALMQVLSMALLGQK